MSGGSFDYLYIKDADQLFSERHSNLKEMAEHLLRFHPDSKAYRDTLAIIQTMDEFQQKVQSILDGGLANVWNAVEWQVSGDYSVEQENESVRDYEVAK